MFEFPDRLGKFMSEVTDRLHKGKQDYGSSSFQRPQIEIIEEIQKECLDLAGWGYILWLRLEWLKEHGGGGGQASDQRDLG